jgi:hypothetical protein
MSLNATYSTGWRSTGPGSRLRRPKRVATWATSVNSLFGIKLVADLVRPLVLSSIWSINEPATYPNNSKLVCESSSIKQMPELTNQAQSWLSDLRRTFELRKSDYASAEIIGGFSTFNAEPILANAVIRFQPWDYHTTRARVDYPNFTLFSEAIQPEAGWQVFEALVRTEPVLIAEGLPRISFGQGTLFEPKRYGSRSYPFDEAWPIDVGQLNGSQDGRLRHGLLASAGGPLYTGPQEAINETTRVPVGWSGFAPVVYLIMSDRRARIVSPRISASGISGGVERGPDSQSGLILKGYVSAVDSAVRGRERLGSFVPPTRFERDEPSGPFSEEVGFFPNHLILALLDKGSGEWLDGREYEAGRYGVANDISFEASPSQVEELIRGGESERVEFKQSFEGDSKWLRTVGAFANGSGGTIFFGVADDTTILGLSDQKPADWVAQRIRTSVEPFPTYRFETVEVEGKTIAYLDTPSGAERPYVVRDQGVFVRAQASTRQASRYEILLLAQRATGTQ